MLAFWMAAVTTVLSQQDWQNSSATTLVHGVSMGAIWPWHAPECLCEYPPSYSRLIGMLSFPCFGPQINASGTTLVGATASAAACEAGCRSSPTCRGWTWQVHR